MKPLKSLTLTALLFLAGCASNNSYLNQRLLTINNSRYSIQNNELKQQSSQTQPIKFGIVSDIHNKPKKAEKFAHIFQKQEVDGILVAGDMAKTIPNPIAVGEKKHIRNSLIPFLETKKPVYVIAGNHETRDGYFKTMQDLANQYDNLFDLATLKYADLQGVNIFGVSGGSPSPIGGFSVKQEIKSIDNAVFSIDNDPVLMISHMPPRFNHKGAIDCVYDVKLKNNKIVKARHKGEKAIYQRKAKERINPRNSGKGELIGLIMGGVDFSVSGHYHMNQGANNLYENILPGTFAYKLFMNPGAAQYDMAGILTIKNNQAKYELFKIEQ